MERNDALGDTSGEGQQAGAPRAPRIVGTRSDQVLATTGEIAEADRGTKSDVTPPEDDVRRETPGGGHAMGKMTGGERGVSASRVAPAVRVIAAEDPGTPAEVPRQGARRVADGATWPRLPQQRQKEGTNVSIMPKDNVSWGTLATSLMILTVRRRARRLSRNSRRR